MKTLIVAALALAMGFTASAKLTDEERAAIKAAKEKLAQLSPEERAARRAQREMKHFGGFLLKEGSGSGRVTYVNTTKKLDTKWLNTELAEIEDLLQINISAVSSDAKVTVANADKELLRSKSEVAIFLVEDDALPVMLVATENDWAILNVSALAKDKPDEKKFLDRVSKEIWRVFGNLCGAADSAMGCVLSPVTTTEDLDALPSKYICPEPMNTIRSHLKHSGVKPYRKATYKEACREGWAHQPTNEFQKAIWDKVHEAPTKPLVIAPEKTKQK